MNYKPTLEGIVGAWNAVSCTQHVVGTHSRDWGDELRGLLIYTRDQCMSASLVGFRSDPNTGEKSMVSSLFYAGSFKLDGDLVHHKIDFSSDTELVNKTLIRNLIVSDKELTLNTIQSYDYGKSSIHWKLTSNSNHKGILGGR